MTLLYRDVINRCDKPCFDRRDKSRLYKKCIFAEIFIENFVVLIDWQNEFY